MNKEIQAYNHSQSNGYKDVCDVLAEELSNHLPKAESKIWHAHPVWFIDGNPIAGYSKQKPGIRLMFWSGASFQEEGLNVAGKKFKDASIFYNDVSEISKKDLKRWLKKSVNIQWDYKNSKVEHIRLDHIERLCILLNCTPNELFEWIPDDLLDDKPNHPLQKIRRRDKRINLLKMIADIPVDKFEEVEKLLARVN